MRVVVDYEVCEANGRCVEAAPEVFELDGEDQLHLQMERPDPSLRERVERAIRLCPKCALSLVED